MTSGPSCYVGNGTAAPAAIPTAWVALQLRLSLSRFQTCQAAVIPHWRQDIFMHACTSVELRIGSCELTLAPCGLVSHPPTPRPSAPLVLMLFFTACALSAQHHPWLCAAACGAAAADAGMLGFAAAAHLIKLCTTYSCRGSRTPWEQSAPCNCASCSSPPPLLPVLPDLPCLLPPPPPPPLLAVCALCRPVGDSDVHWRARAFVGT
mgnify:CR=1 FL=1